MDKGADPHLGKLRYANQPNLLLLSRRESQRGRGGTRGVAVVDVVQKAQDMAPVKFADRPSSEGRRRSLFLTPFFLSEWERTGGGGGSAGEDNKERECSGAQRNIKASRREGQVWIKRVPGGEKRQRATKKNRHRRRRPRQQVPICFRSLFTSMISSHNSGRGGGLAGSRLRQ